MQLTMPDIKTKAFLAIFFIIYILSDFIPIHWLLTYTGKWFMIAFLSWQTASFVTNKFLRPRMAKLQPQNKIVLITGCDSGFGYLSTLTLLRAGYEVFAGCFLPDGEGATRLKTEAAAIGQSSAKRLHIEPLDVTNEESVQKLHQTVKKFLQENPEKRLWTVVNNAGVARLGLIEWGDFSVHFEQIFAVNFFGMVRMTRTFLPLLRGESNNPPEFRIVNVNSILSRFSMQPIVSYCSSKHASACFTEGLRREVAPFNGRVISVEPNFFATPICGLDANLQELARCWQGTPEEVRTVYEKIGAYKKALIQVGGRLFRTSIEKNPQDVADAISNAVCDAQPESRTIIAYSWRRMMLFYLNWMPREWIEWFMDSFEVIINFVG